MADEEVEARALADPDALPLDRKQLVRMRPVTPVRRLRERLGMTQAEFAVALAVPIGILRDWEQRRKRPDPGPHPPPRDRARTGGGAAGVGKLNVPSGAVGVQAGYAPYFYNPTVIKVIKRKIQFEMFATVKVYSLRQLGISELQLPRCQYGR